MDKYNYHRDREDNAYMKGRLVSEFNQISKLLAGDSFFCGYWDSFAQVSVDCWRFIPQGTFEQDEHGDIIIDISSYTYSELQEMFRMLLAEMGRTWLG